MSDGTHTIRRAEELAQIIAATEQAGYSWRTPLYRAVMQGRLSLCEIRRDAVPPLKRLTRAGRPAIVLVGDDDYCSTGPAGWAATPRLLGWSKHAMVHASGGSAETYALAVAMALKAQRFLLIETDTAHLDAWKEALLAARPPVPFLALQPPEGPHPARPVKGALQ